MDGLKEQVSDLEKGSVRGPNDLENITRNLRKRP
jgi:hypothetical protein